MAKKPKTIKIFGIAIALTLVVLAFDVFVKGLIKNMQLSFAVDFAVLIFVAILGTIIAKPKGDYYGYFTEPIMPSLIAIALISVISYFLVQWLSFSILVIVITYALYAFMLAVLIAINTSEN